jgi:hypothetical protein
LLLHRDILQIRIGDDAAIAILACAKPFESHGFSANEAGQCRFGPGRFDAGEADFAAIACQKCAAIDDRGDGYIADDFASTGAARRCFTLGGARCDARDRNQRNKESAGYDKSRHAVP